MGQEENVEAIRRHTDAVREYWSGKGTWRELVAPSMDPDIDYYPVRKWPESRPCHGFDDFERFMTGMNEGWGDLDWEIHSVEAVGDDRVLMHVSLLGEGRGSGMQLGGDVYFCYWLRNGLVIRQEDHLTEAGARRGLGLGA